MKQQTTNEFSFNDNNDEFEKSPSTPSPLKISNANTFSEPSMSTNYEIGKLFLIRSSGMQSDNTSNDTFLFINLVYMMILTVIFLLEAFVLQKYKILNESPNYKPTKTELNLSYIFNKLAGKELYFLMVIHITWTGKYHKVFLLSILVSAKQLFSSLVLIYMSPRPNWAESKKEFVDLRFGNPCIEVMSATMAFIFIARKKVHLRDQELRKNCGKPCTYLTVLLCLFYLVCVVFA